jgi:regulator of nucleoside diphosphate kinase
MSQKASDIYITTRDHESLSWLIEDTRERNGEVDQENLVKLEEELDRAEIVDPKDLPSDVIAMRSQVRVKDLKSGKTATYSLVFPSEANSDQGKLSILAPIGTALLGYRWGDVIEWRVPSGMLDSK